MERSAPGVRLAVTLAVVTIVVGALLLPGLGDGSLQGDEAIYGSVALDSSASGGGIHLELDGRSYVNKPPLLFWLLELSFGIFGGSTWSARLPGALAGFAVAWWIVLEGYRRRALAPGAFVAVLVLSTPVALGLAGDRSFRDVCTDSLLTLCVVLCLGSWGRWIAGRKPRALRYCILFCALGALAKGYLAPAFLVLALAAFLLARTTRPADPAEPRAAVVRGSLLAIGSGLAVSALWLAALELDGATRVWQRVVAKNIWQRWTEGIDPAHLQGPLYYGERIFGDFGGWLLLLIPAVARISRESAAERERSFPAGFAGALFVLLAIVSFSIPVSKLPWYLLPVYPILGLVLARGIEEVGERLRDRRVRALAFAVLTICLGVRVAGAYRALQPSGSDARAPLLRELEAIDPRGELPVYLGPELGFGAPAGGLGAEEYFFVHSRKGVRRELPPRLGGRRGCALLLSADAAALAAIPGVRAAEIRRVERPRPDVGPLWLVEGCPGGAIPASGQ